MQEAPSQSSGITGGHNPEPRALKPIGRPHGATGAGELTSVLRDVPATSQQVSETLRELYSTLPGGLKSLLSGESNLYGPETPSKFAAEEMRALEVVKDFAESALTPAYSSEIVESVARLFNHYTPQFNPAGMAEEYAKHVMRTRKQVQEDWVEALSEYPAWAVREACKRWLYAEEGKFSPKISQIRKLCEELMEPVLRPMRIAESIQARQRKQEELDAFFERQRQQRVAGLPPSKPLEIGKEVAHAE